MEQICNQKICGIVAAKYLGILLVLLFSRSIVHASELPGLLVDKQWLVSNMDNSDVVVIDVRSTEKYKYSHILGAYNISIDKTYPSKGNRLLSINAMKKIFEKAGISNNKKVVLYDEDYKDAARMFWLLEVFGHVNKVGILDGGFPGWIRSNLPQSSEIYQAKQEKFYPTVDPDRYATKMSILLALKATGMMVVDTRSKNDYHGADDGGAGVARVGHIPEAENIPWKENLSYIDGVPRISSVADLSELYAQVTENTVVLIYDDDGKKAAVNYFALRMIGKKAAIYGAGWNEWANDIALPVVKFGSVN
ncbi:MAG: sulfurtransferase [Gammaproteobacteria bacterium]|nr:MAG: sulfurtransferase [Gammaproteobacteria bacterium]